MEAKRANDNEGLIDYSELLNVASDSKLIIRSKLLGKELYSQH